MGTLVGRHTLAESIEEKVFESIYIIHSFQVKQSHLFDGVAALGTAKYKPKVLLEKVLFK